MDIVEDAKTVRFFAPERIRKRAREWGAGEFDRQYNEALQAYVRHSRGWLRIVEGFGLKKLPRCLNESLETRSALMKGSSSLCTGQKAKQKLGRAARTTATKTSGPSPRDLT